MPQSSTNNTTEQNPKLLQGIKVLDLSRILAGPWASQNLADFGATVWKVEKPRVGDDTRHWGPPYVNAEYDENPLSAYFIATNRGKHSVCIDFTQAQGQHIIRELASKADVLIENYKVGGLKQYGLDYESLAQINPGLIYCSITGFGQTGPKAEEAGYDAMIQASGGLMSVTGEPETAGGKPQKVGVAVADLMTGMYATTGILAALNNRHVTGQGQHIDLSLLDTQITMLANQGMNYLVGGKVPQRHGNGHPNIVPYQSFSCDDGEILLAVGNDEQFLKVCSVLGLAAVAADTRFKSNQDRVMNRKHLIPILAKALLSNSTQHWLQQLKQVGVPCGPVNDIEQALNEPQVKHRKMVFEMTGDNQQKIPQIANPLKFSQSDLSYEMPPPLLGGSTEAVLTKELGLTEAEIAELQDAGVI
ncbi:CaiB/BaiF CoA-transferase family protein [Marinicella sp. S1101]|uniref:CaiB/BaiF CoA transferase family protein n=1 Tax=Marinicella marina TaxID=2996016 RepID=UPI002260E0E3|nr:CaiB/BaiF CoA-transferase family protein [Marinicella marina]MCX7554872.1 CaiB/BaiF CoA-transferase family protein [Marinicella marina]MDJ1141530.1 CaiB/BaiF CoA-transferase family protein [Marinicella marina]